MFKILSASLMAVSLGVASTASAGGCSGSSAATASPPSTTAERASGTQARRYSYEPGMGSNRAYRAPVARGWSRDAGAKVRGDFGR